MQTNYLNIHDLVWAITAVECILIASLLKVLPSARMQSRNFLAFFFVLIAAVLTSNLFIWNPSLQELAINGTVLVPAILSVGLLLQGPTLYFYLRSLSQNIEIIRWKHAVHLLPAIVVVLTIVIFDIDGEAWLPWTSLSTPRTMAVKFVWAIVRCLPFLYVLACVLAEYRLRQQIRNHYSTYASADLHLTYAVLGGFFIHWLWSIMGYFIGGYISPEANDLIGVINNYFSVVLVNALFAFGLINSRQLLSLPEESTQPEVGPLEIAKIDEKRKAIDDGIRNQKLYLESHINIDRFAEKVGLRPRELSEMLNCHYQVNFFEFINGFRIEEAKRLLAMNESATETIIDIVYRSGFNSQSAFHRFFKRLVGMTPSQYRKLMAGSQPASSNTDAERPPSLS